MLHKAQNLRQNFVNCHINLTSRKFPDKGEKNPPTKKAQIRLEISTYC